MDRSIEIDLNSANGPKVIVTGSYDETEIEAELPQGWTVGENFGNGVKLADGSWSYPLVRAATTIKIIEQGNGLDVSAGDLVYDSAHDELLRLTSEPGTIHTDDSRGNYVLAEAEIDGDVTDLSDAEFAALPSVRIARD